jgi:hypothetical protein
MVPYLFYRSFVSKPEPGDVSEPHIEAGTLSVALDQAKNSYFGISLNSFLAQFSWLLYFFVVGLICVKISFRIRSTL